MTAFSTVPVSTPGRHGLPFIVKKPAKKIGPSQGKRPFARKEGTPTSTTNAGPEEKRYKEEG